MTRLVGIVAIALVLLTPTVMRAQVAAGTILSPDGDEWRDLALYRGGGRLFVLDYTNSRILVYAAASLAYASEIDLSSYSPDKPQSLAVNETTGKLYVTLSTGNATSDTRALVINANTLAAGPMINSLGWDVLLTIDEARSRIYAISVSQGTLKAIDANTHSVTGTLDLDALMPNGLMSFSENNFNATTGELFFTNLHYDQFLIVNGLAMTGQLMSVTGSRGWSGAWNPAENKIYITRIAWDGYFIYDRDTQASAVTSCINDGTELFYSAPTNRIYSGAEINGDTTVIEGASNSCQNVEVGGGMADVALLPSKGLVFFAGTASAVALNESTLLETATAATCGGGYGAVGTRIIADDTAGRVYLSSTWSSPSRDSCILVLSTPSLAIADAAVAEGNAGTKTLSFTVTMSAAAAGSVTVHYASSNGTASSAQDYQATSGTLTFLAGETTKTITVTINGDASCEGDETLLIDLDTPTAGVTIADAHATGTIIDDDGSAAPANVVATPNTATSVGITWSAVGDAASYDVFRNLAKIASTAALSYTDNTAASGTAYLYAVRSVNGASCPSPLSAPDLATTVIFSDPVLTPVSTTVKAAHATELRTAIAAVRALAALGVYSYGETLSAGTIVRALQITELRNALDAARSALGLPALTYADALAPGTLIKAAQIDELRNGVR